MLRIKDKIAVLLVTSLVLGPGSFAQGKKVKALFIGNSYTYVNDLPQLTATLAASLGDTLVFETQAQGGFTLGTHTITQASTDAIKKGGWDYVVLQEQSQLPAGQEIYVQQSMYPYARKLDSLIHIYNPCANTIFYMTWGRKNGDAGACVNWPPVCTYEGMDSMLRLRYMIMANNYKASVSPVGPVWHYIRDHYPSIELYQADESHPAEAGSYAGACAFYTAIFKRSPVGSAYNYTLNATDASHIRSAAKIVVFDSMSTWNIGTYELMAGFSYSRINTQVSFNNTSANAASYAWDFGDGQTSALASPVHNYAVQGIYNIRLVATDTIACNDTANMVINLYPDGIPVVTHNDITVSPNPAGDHITLGLGTPYATPCMITLQNYLGRVVYRQQYTPAGPLDIDISALPKGMYILHITAAGREICTRKIIRQ